MPTFTIAAIETLHAGCRFRSRLEARWSVFFDAIGIRWEYEPQGYVLPSGACYLPDFRLPELDIHVEVKGDEDAFIADSPRYVEAVETGALPGRGLLILGPVPNPVTPPLHFILGRECLNDGDTLHADLLQFAGRTGDPEIDLAFIPCTDIAARTSGELPDATLYGRRDRQLNQPSSYTAGTRYPDEWPEDPFTAAAYRAARSARFEHGENG